MRPRTVLAAIAAACIALVATLTTARAADSDEATLKKIEHDWATALAKADVATIQKITASDWTLTDPMGKLVAADEANQDLKSGKYKLQSFTIDDLKVRVFGDTAVVHGLGSEKSTYDGQDTSGQYRFTDVFVRKGGTWKAVSTHVTKVAAKM